jgi:nicotinamidase/pyrazinamidase
MKNFVVIVDTQYDFMMPDGILYVKGAEEIISPMIQYLASLKPEATNGVLFTFDTHTKEDYEGSPESEMFPLHCEMGTMGWENILNLNIVNSDIEVFTVEKPVFDMWSSEEEIVGEYNWFENANNLFGSLQDETDGEIIIDIIGVALNFCVKQAADGFIERGFKVRLHTSMTRGIDTGNPGDLDARILYADEIAAGKVIVVD